MQAKFMVPEYELPAVKTTLVIALVPGETGEGAGAVTTSSEIVTVVVPLASA